MQLCSVLPAWSGSCIGSCSATVATFVWQSLTICLIILSPVYKKNSSGLNRPLPTELLTDGLLEVGPSFSEIFAWGIEF